MPSIQPLLLIILSGICYCDVIMTPGIFVLPTSSQSSEVKFDEDGWKVKEKSDRSILDIHISASPLINFKDQVAFTVNDKECNNVLTIHSFDTNDRCSTKGYIVHHTFTEKNTYYICIRSFNSTKWQHQGTCSKHKLNISFEKHNQMPIWLSLLIILMCLFLSGLFSGLNLGLMSLDLSDLKVLQEAGSVTEKYYASVIYPLRKRGNFLLCSILLSNTLVNCAQTIVMDSILKGMYAAFAATMIIVIFGEIIPQAICSRHGLAISAKTSFFTKAVMILTSPLSWPFGNLNYCMSFFRIGVLKKCSLGLIFI